MLRKELDSLEGELTKALDERYEACCLFLLEAAGIRTRASQPTCICVRSRIMARSSPARIQELEVQVSQLQQDLEVTHLSYIIWVC